MDDGPFTEVGSLVLCARCAETLAHALSESAAVMPADTAAASFPPEPAPAETATGAVPPAVLLTAPVALSSTATDCGGSSAGQREARLPESRPAEPQSDGHLNRSRSAARASISNDDAEAGLSDKSPASARSSSGDMPEIPEFLRRDKYANTFRVAASSEIQAAPNSSSSVIE
jgi:hypothetical protein